MRYCKKLDCAGTIVEREGTGTRMREERRGRPKKKKRPDFIKRASERASKKKTWIIRYKPFPKRGEKVVEVGEVV